MYSIESQLVYVSLLLKIIAEIEAHILYFLLCLFGSVTWLNFGFFFTSHQHNMIYNTLIAKVVPMKTFTMCGTPSYLAPEVITQRGHDKGAR